MVDLFAVRTPEDVLLGIFYFIPQEKLSFERDMDALEDFFSRNKGDFPVLKDMTRDGIYQACRNLAVVGPYMCTQSPRHDTYFVHPMAKRLFEDRLKPRFSPAELNELEQISLEFQKELIEKQKGI